MGQYQYKAIDKNNKVIKERGIADNEEELMMSLRSRGYYLLQCKKNTNFARKISSKELFILCEQLSTLLTSGITIAKALEILEKQNFNNEVKSCISSIKLEVIKGNQLYKSMKEFNNIFPTLMIEMIRVGENSGNLDKTLQYLANHYDKEYKLYNDIKTSLTYPTIVFVVSIIITILLTVNAIPIFMNILFQCGVQISPLTKILFTVSGDIKNNFGFILTIMGIICVLFRRNSNYRTKLSNNINYLVYKIPYLHNLKLKMYVQKFSSVMGMLIQSGISIVDSLEIVQLIIENENFEKQIKSCIKNIKNGKSLTLAFKSFSFFDDIQSSMLEVGEESGNLDEIFYRIAYLAEKEIDYKSKRLIKFIEPSVTILLSIFVGMAIIALILPMMNIVDSIGL